MRTEEGKSGLRAAIWGKTKESPDYSDLPTYSKSIPVVLFGKVLGSARRNKESKQRKSRILK